MRTVHIAASKEYDVRIGAGLLPALGLQACAIVRGRKVCIVSETTVWPLYGTLAEASLKEAGFSVISYVFPAGEENKNGATYLSLLNHLAENQLTRSDLIVALGGGVVGDLAGFAAATFLRGIAFIQVPTSLLAAVDSSVGGKTAIDLPAGKNLAGAFCQPNLVICDTDCLKSLPEPVFTDGCAEVIKYGILYDPALFRHLEQHGKAFDPEAVIARCVELKGNAVCEDEFDTGARMRLNLGHTFGHAVEAESHLQISHGKGVAIGTAIITRAAFQKGMCSKETRDRILALLEQFGLPLSCSYTASALSRAALSDKKRSGGSVSLIVPREIGCCDIIPTPVEEIQSFIEAGL